MMETKKLIEVTLDTRLLGTSNKALEQIELMIMTKKVVWAPEINI